MGLKSMGEGIGTLTPRRRRQPEEARAAALDSARRLLLDHGPNAITLQAVARDIGMTHTNLLHHFGSAAALQSALMRDMVNGLVAAVIEAVERYRAGTGDIGEFVDLVFAAFDRGGAARLAAWLSLSGNAELIRPVGDAVRDYIERFEAGSPLDTPLRNDLHRRLTSTVLLVIIAACGDAILGDTLHCAAERERGAVRNTLHELMPVISAAALEREARG